MIRVSVCGVMGRMGQQFVQSVTNDPGLILIGGVVKPGQSHPSNDVRFADWCSRSGVVITESLYELLEICDVIIDSTFAVAVFDVTG